MTAPQGTAHVAAATEVSATHWATTASKVATSSTTHVTATSAHVTATSSHVTTTAAHVTAATSTAVAAATSTAVASSSAVAAICVTGQYRDSTHCHKQQQFAKRCLKHDTSLQVCQRRP